MIIDAHAHFVPQALLDALTSQRSFPSVKVAMDEGGVRFAFAGQEAKRPVPAGMSDVDRRRRWLSDRGIDKQVVGGWLDMFGYDLPPEEGLEWSRFLNAHMLKAVSAIPFLVPLATVPMQDGNRAAAVLKAAVAAGFPGVMIGTLPRGIGSVLDAPDLDPFWAAADGLGAVVHIHPSFDAGDVRVNAFGLQNAVGRISDAIVAVARLLYSGHVTRYANAKFVVSMGAAGLPFVLGRMKRNQQITPGISDPVDSLGRLYTDTILHDPRVLRFVITMMGADRIMLGSDMPFPIGDAEPMKIVADAGVTAEQAASINGGLAARLFRLG